MEESLNESLGEITDAQPIEDGAAVGMATVISDLIKDEYEAIDGYNSAIATAQAEGFEDMVNVLTEIQAEENLHIGQLQALMNTIDPNAHLVDDGQQEGIEQLANPLGGNDITEDLDDMSLEDQRMFIRCVNEIWNMSVMEWTQKYYAGQLEVTTVNSYENIPDTSNLIEISSSDLSQGTGNVIVYTYMDAGDGSLYRYASF
jgi:rubrerythrin